MSQHPSPPPGAVPSDLGSPDVSSMMQQLANAKSGQTGNAGTTDPTAAGMGTAGQAASAKQPRQFTGPVQELKYFTDDAFEAALSFLPPFLQNMLKPASQDSPETKQRKQQIFQNYQRLSAEQQQVAQKRMHEQQQRAQEQQQEAEMKRRQEAQRAEQSASVPQGKVSGNMSGKSRTLQKLQDDRTKQGSAGAG